MSSSSSKVATYVPNYWNPAGPGDYNIPAYSETAAYRNSPGYSMGPRTKLPYFKGFEIVSALDLADKIFRNTKAKQLQAVEYISQIINMLECHYHNGHIPRLIVSKARVWRPVK